MRLPLNDLEEALDDPDGYVRRAQSDKKRFIPRGRQGVMRNSLLRWHKGKITAEAARAEFIEKCNSFENGAAEVLDQFDGYVKTYQSAAVKSPLARMRVRVRLPEGADPRFRIGAEVFRLDRGADGIYTAWLAGKRSSRRHEDVLLPLIQAAVAEHLNLYLDEVEIAIYGFQDGADRRFRFTEAQVLSARAGLLKLLEQLAPLVAKEPMPAEPLQQAFEF